MEESEHPPLSMVRELLALAPGATFVRVQAHGVTLEVRRPAASAPLHSDSSTPEGEPTSPEGDYCEHPTVRLGTCMVCGRAVRGRGMREAGG